MTDSTDKCGTSDFCNNSAVLWDNIDPHLGGESAGTYTWTIQLPNVECENCVLQVIQVMEDIAFGFHGPFDGAEDMYHRCIDIKLQKGAGTSGPGNAPGAAIKVGTPGSKYPNPNKNCVGGSTPTGDAGVGNDAGISNDAGQSLPDSGSPSGPAGGPGGVGGSSGGVAGGTGIAGGAAGTSGGGAGIAGGGATAGGGTGSAGGGTTTGGGAAGTGGTVGGGAPSGTVPPGDEDPNDDGCDCAVSDNSPRYGNLISMSLLALGLLARRRRLSR
jgi:MYXO-CTERM domain-containing protein